MSQPKPAWGPLRGLFLVVTLAASWGCTSSQGEANPTVARLIRHGRFGEALEVAKRATDERPEDAEARDLYLNAQVAYLMGEGRRASFDEEPEEALALFVQALELDPSNGVVRTWIEKIRKQLADERLTAAQEAFASDDYAGAIELLESALEFDPDNLRAKESVGRALVVMNYRAGLSKSYYDDGLRSLRELLLPSAGRDFGISSKYGPDDERPEERQDRVEGLLAEERLAQAEELEAQGLYFAARNEYRLSLLLDPEVAAARDGFNRMDREVRAAINVSKADMDIRGGELGKAAALLEEADSLSEAQKDQISLKEAEIEETRFRELYDRAVSFERDYKYTEAVEVYGQLLEETEVFADARERKATVEWMMSEAESLYAQAQEAPEPEDALELYGRIDELIWPEFRDVRERMAQIERELARQAAVDGSDGG